MKQITSGRNHILSSLVVSESAAASLRDFGVGVLGWPDAVNALGLEAWKRGCSFGRASNLGCKRVSSHPL